MGLPLPRVAPSEFFATSAPLAIPMGLALFCLQSSHGLGRHVATCAICVMATALSSLDLRSSGDAGSV